MTRQPAPSAYPGGTVPDATRGKALENLQAVGGNADTPMCPATAGEKAHDGMYKSTTGKAKGQIIG